MTDPTSALSAVPAAGDRRARSLPAALKFFYGPMDCGKSTLALQIDHNHARQGRHGLLLSKLDRSGRPLLTSRIGITRQAIEVGDDTDLRELVRSRWAQGQPVDYLVCDEAQFYSAAQVEQMVDLVDLSSVDVYAFGIATDFQSRMFPGSRRLFELADELVVLQVEVLCWCGRSARFNGRVVAGRLTREGSQVVVADTDPAAASSDVRYQVLCRQHFRAGDLGGGGGEQQQLPLG